MFNIKEKLDLYKEFGFTEKALNDKDWEIRLEAYRKLGFTEKALDDKDYIIRLEAEKFYS